MANAIHFFIAVDIFTPFETMVLRAACSRDPASEVALRQLESAVFTKRDRTGHGLFVRFQADREVGPIEKTNGRILLGSNRVSLRHPKLAQGGDIIVWLDNGVIDCLETVVFGVEPWPDDEEQLFEIQEWPLS